MYVEINFITAFSYFIIKRIIKYFSMASMNFSNCRICIRIHLDMKQGSDFAKDALKKLKFDQGASIAHIKHVKYSGDTILSANGC